MKTLKFKRQLADLVFNGQKTTTWRLFDDKDLKIGDKLDLKYAENDENFAKAEIIGLVEKKLKDVKKQDFLGHETYSSEEEILKTYQGYYGNKVSFDSIVKIIKFKLI